MEHSDGGQDDSSSPEKDESLPVSPNHVTTSQSLELAPALSQQLPDSQSLDASNYSGFLLALGCDSNEEEEEELRNVKETAENLLPSPVQQCKFSSKFTLTPVLARKGNEEPGNKQHHNLTTPNQGLSVSMDCPERPSKLHRTSTSQYESSTSCRHLFSAVAPTTPAPIEEEDDCSDQRHPNNISNKHALPQEGVKASFSSPNKQSHVFKEGMDDLPTPIHSPSSSSSCSDCVECSSSGSSPGSSPPISCTYLGSLPILSRIELANQMIVSSPERDGKRETTVKRLDPPLACDSQAMPQKPEERNFEDSRPQHTHRNPLQDAKGEGQGMKALPVSTFKEIEKEEEEFSAARRVNNEVLEASFVPSSAGSVHSNWTTLSGISPLPSSDPTHLACCRLRHHHGHHHHHHHHHSHHHHGHHHHHYHRKHQDKAKGGDNMFTSTPIHQKHRVEMVDVSAVVSSQEPFSDPRFVISSELVFPDSESDGEGEAVEEENNSNAPTSISKSVEKESTRPKRLGQSMSEEHAVELEDKKEQGSEKLMENNFVSATSILSEREMVERGLVGRKRSYQQSRARGSYIQPRPLSRAEAEDLFAAHVNFAGDIFESEYLPSPRHSSTVDETLFRAVPLESCLSATLD